jgi:hypothetical protein
MSRRCDRGRFAASQSTGATTSGFRGTDRTRPRFRRPWLLLLDDEHLPDIIDARKPDLVVWSSLWDCRPDARIRFELPQDGHGTDLHWVLLVDEPVPGASLLGHMRRRINDLINANLRYTFGR